VGINVELPSEQAGAVLQAVIGPRLSRPLVGVVLRQTMAVAASAGLDEFVAAADRHPVFELTITETTKVPGSVPAALIGVGANRNRHRRQPRAMPRTGNPPPTAHRRYPLILHDCPVAMGMRRRGMRGSIENDDDPGGEGQLPRLAVSCPSV
jgi:hypothetical protein